VIKRILIVEDDPMLVEIYSKKFMSEGFEADTAVSGVEAEKKVKEGNFDLVLLDLVLPEADGFDVLKKIKEDPATSAVKVVVFSNLSQEEDKERVSSLGADGFLTKSDYTPGEIVQHIKELLA
jgi:two-component system, cell cycle response regulator